jgi:cysteinyl-tRNA synthetase
MNRQSVETYATVGPISDVAIGQILREHNEIDVAEQIRVALANGDSFHVEKLKRVVESWGVRISIDEFNHLSFEATNLLDAEALRKSADDAIAARNAARKAKNFKEADRIRDELLAKGIVLKDGPTGTTWEVKR